MTKTPIDLRRLQFESRGGSGRLKQHGDGNLRVPTPPRNAPCPCGSGKKAKRCHPDGLQPIVKRVTPKGECAACGAKDVEVIPLKHEGLKGWQQSVCFACVRTPEETFKKLQAAVEAAKANRTATVIVYACEKCGETDLVDVVDSSIAAGNLPPRSTPCEPCGVPRLPVAARRATPEEFGELCAAGIAKDEATVKRFLGDGKALGTLPGVQVKTIPFAGDLVMLAAVQKPESASEPIRDENQQSIPSPSDSGTPSAPEGGAP